MTESASYLWGRGGRESINIKMVIPSPPPPQLCKIQEYQDIANFGHFCFLAKSSLYLREDTNILV